MKHQRLLVFALLFFIIHFAPILGATCTSEETYCAEYTTRDCNCQDVSYTHDCTKYGVVGSHEECDSCDDYDCSTEKWTECDSCRECDTCSRKVNCETCGWWIFTYDCNCDTEYFDCNCYYEDCNCVEHSQVRCEKTGSHKCNCKEVDDYGYYTGTCTDTREECDSCRGSCARFATRTKTYECRDLDINNVNIDDVSAGSIKVRVDYESNINSVVSFYFDLVQGSWNSCHKLTCGNPSIDTDCGVGGCDSKAEKIVSVSKGSDSFEYIISVPSTLSESYELYVGAWTNERLDSYDYGSVNMVGEYPKTVSRGDESFEAYNSKQEVLLEDFLGINPPATSIDSYLVDLSNNGLDDWSNYWTNKWSSINKPNSDALITFTQDKHDYYYDSGTSFEETCNDEEYSECFNSYLWWYDCNDERTSVKQRCSHDCVDGECVSNVCEPNSYYDCYNSDLVWYNSCGEPGSIKEECSNKCENKECIMNDACPNDWTKYDGSCYYNFGKKKWSEAVSVCENHDAYIVTINSGDENNWVNNFAGGRNWIGLNDRSSEGMWEWIGEVSEYTNWNSGEPNNVGNEDCVEVYNSGRWNDISCESRKQTICEYNTYEEDDCPSGWFGYKNSCYKEVRGKWDDVRRECESYDSHIISINNDEENNFASSYGNIWIGINDRSSEGMWVWEGGSSDYENWNSGEPNNAGNEDCAHIRREGNWNDRVCNDVRKSLCEKKACTQRRGCDSCLSLSKGESCDCNDECDSRQCTNGVCSTKGCDIFLSLSENKNCDCNSECKSGLVCENICITPCTQTSSCDSCLELNKGEKCDCDNECNTEYCNNHGECSEVSSFTFYNTQLCKDNECTQTVTNSVGKDSNLFLTGEINNLGAECNVDYTLYVCGESYSDTLKECDDLVFVINAHKTGYCNIRLSLEDNINEGRWTGGVGGFNINSEEESINPINNTKTVFEPANGSYTKTEDFINQIMSGEYDTGLTHLINTGYMNSEIISILLVSILGVGGVASINLRDRRRIFKYLMDLRGKLSGRLSGFIDEMTGIGFTPFGKQYVNDKGREMAAVDTQLVHSTFSGSINDRISSEVIYSYDFNYEEDHIASSYVRGAGKGIEIVSLAMIIPGLVLMGGGAAIGVPLAVTAGKLSLGIGAITGFGGGVINLFGHGMGVMETNNGGSAYMYAKKNKGDIILTTGGLVFDVCTLSGEVDDLIKNIDEFGGHISPKGVITAVDEQAIQNIGWADEGFKVSVVDDFEPENILWRKKFDEGINKWDDITKYIDESTNIDVNVKNIDEISSISKTDNAILFLKNSGKYNDESIELIKKVLKKARLTKNNKMFVKYLLINSNDEVLDNTLSIIKKLDGVKDMNVRVHTSIKSLNEMEISSIDLFVEKVMKARDDVRRLVKKHGENGILLKNLDEIRFRTGDDAYAFSAHNGEYVGLNFEFIQKIDDNDLEVMAYEEVLHQLAPDLGKTDKKIRKAIKIPETTSLKNLPESQKKLLNEAHDFFTMKKMKEYDLVAWKNVKKSFTKQTNNIPIKGHPSIDYLGFKDLKELSKHKYFTPEDLSKIDLLLDPEKGGPLMAKNLALNEENVKYLDDLEDIIMKSKIYKKKILLENIKRVRNNKKVFKKILKGKIW